MRVLRGRAAAPEVDRAVTAAMLDRTGETEVPGFRAWTPHRQVAFGRRDAREPGYDRARAAAERRGYAAVERSVGGRAVAYTGTTVAFAHAVPVGDSRTGIADRYGAATEAVERALESLGAAVRPGEPPDAFCPGDHSLRGARAGDGRGGTDGPGAGKVAGLAQRVRGDAALVAGVVIPTDRAELAAAYDPVYRALGAPFDPDSVGSVADCGGPADPEATVRALEGAFAGGRPTTVERVGDRPGGGG